MTETLHERNERLAGELVQARAALAEATEHGDHVAALRAQEAADHAVQLLHDGNVKIVYRYVNRFAGAPGESSDEEYANAGKEALLGAILSWDPAKGTLANWAWPFIKKAVLREVAQTEHRLKANAFEARGRVLEAEAALREQLGRHPTDAEVAKVAGVSEVMALTLRLNEASGKARSLNQVVGEDGTELGEIVGPTTPSAEDVALGYGEDEVELLSEMEPAQLAELTKLCDIWELTVGLRHLGADDGPAQDFQEMVPLLQVSRETLRKLYAKFAQKIS